MLPQGNGLYIKPFRALLLYVKPVGGVVVICKAFSGVVFEKVGEPITHPSCCRCLKVQ